MSDIKLPELPEPAFFHDDRFGSESGYTADQLREYAKQAVELERERILDLLNDVQEPEWYGRGHPYTFHDGVIACHRAIRGTK